MELVGAVDGTGRLEQVQRRALGAFGGLDHRLVLGRVLVGLEEDAVELLAHRRRAAALHQLGGPGVDLRCHGLLAFDAQQRGLDGLLGRLPEQPPAEAAEVVRRVEQAQQRRRLLVGAGAGVVVLARQVGEAEFPLGRELPGQPEVDLGGLRLRLRHQLGRRGLVEAKHDVGHLDLDALARVQFHLHRAVGFGQQAAGVEFAGVVEHCIHRWDCRRSRPGRTESGAVASDRQVARDLDHRSVDVAGVVATVTMQFLVFSRTAAEISGCGAGDRRSPTARGRRLRPGVETRRRSVRSSRASPAPRRPWR